MELMETIQGEPYKIYPKWFSRTRQFGQNIGDVPGHANKWLSAQGVLGTFDRFALKSHNP